MCIILCDHSQLSDFHHIVSYQIIISIADRVKDFLHRSQFMQESLCHGADFGILRFDVAGHQQKLNGLNKARGEEHFHQAVKVILVIVFLQDVQTLVLSLAGVVNLILLSRVIISTVLVLLLLVLVLRL